MGTGLAVTTFARLLGGAVLLALLAACGDGAPRGPSTDLGKGATIGTLAKATFSQLPGRKAAAAPAKSRAKTSRADLEKFNVPVLRVGIPVRSTTSFVTPIDTKGDIVTWSAPDGTTFTLRSGVLIQTRGLGPDLMSSQAPTVAQLLTPGGTHQRQYFFLGTDDRTTRRAYDCTVTIGDQEEIEIMGRSHKVTRVSEECARPQGKITNDFWFEGQTIRKSRQLISGGAGFGNFELVID